MEGVETLLCMMISSENSSATDFDGLASWIYWRKYFRENPVWVSRSGMKQSNLWPWVKGALLFNIILLSVVFHHQPTISLTTNRTLHMRSPSQPISCRRRCSLDLPTNKIITIAYLCLLSVNANEDHTILSQNAFQLYKQPGVRHSNNMPRSLGR
jgi:hypothetical protein